MDVMCLVGLFVTFVCACRTFHVGLCALEIFVVSRRLSSAVDGGVTLGFVLCCLCEGKREGYFVGVVDLICWFLLYTAAGQALIWFFSADSSTSEHESFIIADVGGWRRPDQTPQQDSSCSPLLTQLQERHI